jgi:hypothetical protein
MPGDCWDLLKRSDGGPRPGMSEGQMFQAEPAPSLQESVLLPTASQRQRFDGCQWAKGSEELGEIVNMRTSLRIRESVDRLAMRCAGEDLVPRPHSEGISAHFFGDDRSFSSSSRFVVVLQLRMVMDR